jgi:mRNA interferase MazF
MELRILFRICNETDPMLPEQAPPAVQPRITAAPKLRQLYWCDFPSDAQLPEMWKRRPVVIVSYKNTLHGPCTIIPTTTAPQGNSPWAYQLSPHIDWRASWAVCNHPYTIAPSRLSPVRGKIPQVTKEEFNEILKRLTLWLPRPFELDTSGEPS